VAGPGSPLAKPVEQVIINGKQIGNRIAIQPMEGWDGTTTGGITEDVLRRWQRFGESGAKLIYGGEAMAVRPDGRANPNQLIISDENKSDLARLRETLIATHRQRFGQTEDLVIGFQLTHSGRFCKPYDKTRMEPRVAYRHPILDKKFKVTSDEQVWTDGEIERLIGDYVKAAEYLGRACECADESEDLLLKADVTEQLAELYWTQKRHRDMLANLNQSHALYSRLKAQHRVDQVERRNAALEARRIQAFADEEGARRCAGPTQRRFGSLIHENPNRPEPKSKRSGRCGIRLRALHKQPAQPYHGPDVPKPVLTAFQGRIW